jgi:hypothetical protein
MGARFSQQTKKCNYHCPICKATGATPNIAGRFFIINETQCQCNGCNTIFEKDMFYAQPDNPNNLDGSWSCPKMNIENETGTQAESVQ